MEYIPLNFAIMRHPINWVTVLLMVLIAGFMLDLLAAWISKSNPDNA